MTNKNQMTGRHPHVRRQSNSNTDQQPKTSNRYDALPEELIEDGITFHHPGPTDEETPTNQRPTRSTDTMERTRTEIIGFHPKTNLRMLFDSHSKTEDKKCFPTKHKVLSSSLQLDKKYRMLYAHLRLYMYGSNALLNTGAFQRAMCESELQ